jgi:acyl-CoA thioesterase-1
MKWFGYAFVLVVLAVTCNAAHAQIVAFGASNVSGWNVAATAAFPAQLQDMLRANGYGVCVINAGVYGNTTAEMLARVDRDVPAGTKIVILDTTGGIFNDMHKGIAQSESNTNMAALQARLQARGITIVPASGAELGPAYHQQDGAHLTPEGHRMLASQLLPQVERVLGPPQTTQAQPSSTDTPTEAVRDACAADARRLCAAFLGDDARRHECMHEHRAELSHDCLATIMRNRQ